MGNDYGVILVCVFWWLIPAASNTSNLLLLRKMNGQWQISALYEALMGYNRRCIVYLVVCSSVASGSRIARELKIYLTQSSNIKTRFGF